MAKGNSGTLIFAAFAIFGLYFINLYLKILDISKFFAGASGPANFATFNGFVSLIGGILLILGGFKFMGRRDHYERR